MERGGLFANRMARSNRVFFVQRSASALAFAAVTTASMIGAGWFACSGAADSGVQCLQLTCPEGYEPDQAACTCRSKGGGVPADAATADQSSPCGSACAAGQACNPTSGACEASPGGGVVRTDLVNKEMSIGINNNGSGPPQGIREAHLDFNWAVSKTNTIVAVAVPPGRITIDGADTSPAEWSGVPVSTLTGMARASTLLPLARRSNGTATNITTEDFGVTTVKIAAAYDGSSIYFRVEWEDTSQNNERGRWIWNGTRWVRDTTQTQPLPEGNSAPTRAVTGSEDRLSLLFNINVPAFFGDNGGLGAGCAGLCHLEGKGGNRVAIVTTTDAGTTFLSGSGLMNTNAPGQKVDVWEWTATRSNTLRIFDDQVIDENSRHGDGLQNEDFTYTGGTCTRKSADGLRYPAVSGGSAAAQSNFANEYFDDVTAGCPSLGPSRVPSPYAANVKAMFEERSPFIGKNGATGSSLAVGAVTPNVGDTMPGYVWLTATSSCLRCQNEAEGRWAAGKWIVEMRRSLVAPDPDDVDFTIVQR